MTNATPHFDKKIKGSITFATICCSKGDSLDQDFSDDLL